MVSAYAVHNGACLGSRAPSSSRHTFYFYLRNVEGTGTLTCVNTREPATSAEGETFAQVLAALKDEYGTNDSRIAAQIGAHVSTVNNWAHGKSQPRPAAIRALAAAIPKFTEERLFASVGKRAPAPLEAGGRERVLEVFDRLTKEQQEMLLIQASAVADANDRQP